MIALGYFFVHAILFICFYLMPLKVDVSSISNMKISDLYRTLGAPTYEAGVKNFIGWENCSRIVCKSITAIISPDSTTNDERPKSITVKNIYNGKTIYFRRYVVLHDSKTTEYVTVWPYGTFCVSCGGVVK